MNNAGLEHRLGDADVVALPDARWRWLPCGQIDLTSMNSTARQSKTDSQSSAGKYEFAFHCQTPFLFSHDSTVRSGVMQAIGG